MQTRVLILPACLSLLLSCSAVTAQAPGRTAATRPAEPATREPGVALTVYNGDFGVVRETRAVTIGDDGSVRFTDVAAQIDPTTVHFRSLTDPSARLLEQNFQYDLVNADRLLQKYLDKPVQVVADGTTYDGTLQSFDGQNLVLLDDAGRPVIIRRPENVRDIRLSALPEGLLTRPTLVWQVDTGRPGEHLTEVSYQTGAINWHAEYVLVLEDNDTAANLAGWVSVDNRSGKTYRDARLKFIAGDVRRVQPPRPMMEKAYGLRAAGEMAAPMREKAFFEYHMYTLPRPSTVADRQTKQLEMFVPVQGLKVDKRYLYHPLARFGLSYRGRYTDPSYGAENVSDDVNIFVEFKNSRENQLGIPLPAGKVRAYKRDPDDEALEFIGEEMIEHTPKDENLSLLIGNAFDIVGQRRQTDFRVESGRKWMRESIEIQIRNHKDQDVVVRVKEPLYRWLTWRITRESHDSVKLDARTAAWDLPVPADGQTTLTYTVEYTW